MWGCSSRAPFPILTHVDWFGLFSKSGTRMPSVSTYQIKPDEQNLLWRFRRECMKSLAQHLPIKEYLDDILSQYDSIVLFGCQVDQYFAYNSCLPEGAKQATVVEDVLKKTPQSIGVIVTEHTYGRQISEKEVRYLKNKYSNFIYYSENVANPSQFFLPYVDGVITVSSAIAYQAALWRKPLYIIGESQLNPLACTDDYNFFLQKSCSYEMVDKDSILYAIISVFNYRLDYNDPELCAKYLSDLNAAHNHFTQTGQLLDPFLVRKTVKQVEKMLMQGLQINKFDYECNRYIAHLKKRDHLRIGMCETKVISYDLFDTLVERDFDEPHELFLFIEPRIQNLVGNRYFRYRQFRRDAEAEARRYTYGEFDITVDQIYEKFKNLTGLDSKTVAEIKRLELEAEVSLVHPKRKMLREFNMSKLLSERVSIITDIYLSEEVIRSILKKCNITDFDSLWVSSETKTKKHNGSIYPEYIKWVKSQFPYDLAEERIFHVGDNPVADGEMADKYGFRTYVFPRAHDNLNRSSLSKEFLRKAHGHGCISTSILQGRVANKFYNNHYGGINEHSYFKGSAYSFGYTALGPMVFGFIHWLYQRAIGLGLENLYFLARDGWILKQVYDDLYQNVAGAPKSYYLYSSRRAVTVPMIKNEMDAFEVGTQTFNARTLSSFLEMRFGLSENDIDKKLLSKQGYKLKDIVSPHYEQPKLRSLIKSLMPMILKTAERERHSYVDYLESIDFVKNSKAKNCAVVDIGYSGSMQLGLKRILDLDTLGGFYFLTHNKAAKYFTRDVFEGYLANLDDGSTSCHHPLNDQVFIFETVLSSPEGSLLNFTGLGSEREMNLLYAEEEEKRRVLLEDFHRGAREFSSDLHKRFGSYVYDISFSPILSSAILLKFAEQPAAEDAQMFVNVEVENLFGGGSVSLIASPFSAQLSSAQMEQLLKRSQWKEGAKAYYSSLLKAAPSLGRKATASPKVEETAKTPAKESSKTTLVNVERIEPPLTVAEKAMALLQSDEFMRKRAKLTRSPYQFFADSSNQRLQQIKDLFNEDHVLGRQLTKLVRRTL